MVEITAGLLLLVAALFDFKTMRIPNRLQVIALLAIVAMIAITDPHSWKVRAAVSLILAVLLFLCHLFKVAGGGDVKMMFWFGAGFGLHAVAILCLGSILMTIWTLGKMIARKEKKWMQWMPLAPFLACGGLMWFLFFKLYVMGELLNV